MGEGGGHCLCGSVLLSMCWVYLLFSGGCCFVCLFGSVGGICGNVGEA